jgi:hypothetical protein
MHREPRKGVEFGRCTLVVHILAYRSANDVIRALLWVFACFGLRIGSSQRGRCCRAMMPAEQRTSKAMISDKYSGPFLFTSSLLEVAWGTMRSGKVRRDRGEVHGLDGTRNQPDTRATTWRSLQEIAPNR